jgi:hypothetical protein
MYDNPGWEVDEKMEEAASIVDPLSFTSPGNCKDKRFVQRECYKLL